MNPLLFWSKAPSEVCRQLSNFWACKVRDPKTGRTWASSEHAYFYLLATDQAGREAILAAPNAAAAKAIAKSHPQHDWKGRHINCMKWALWWKFACPTLRSVLLGTGEQQLVHYAPWGDTYWGVDKNMQGRNLQGDLLMQLRAKLQA